MMSPCAIDCVICLLFLFVVFTKFFFKLYHSGQNRPRPGVTCFTLAYIGKTLKIFLPENTRPRALIFGVYHQLVVHFQVC